ncbi:hypothetical protein CCR75_002346 [Bremia lactucae]|uniref:ATP-dependent DNA helicase n=1 Tax=Bremia lactucae TaxID=4779 RepID=A0A976IFC8_BRELC|nr:hypothetical protein CCR75_002346 [Bremia lactucae]
MQSRVFRSSALLRTTRCRKTSTCSQALDDVYRKLLERGEFEDFQVTEAQSTAVSLASQGYSVFLHLPTGAGKSLAFQAPALLTASNQITLVVSPLIALLNDQVAALKRKGIHAIQVSGGNRNKSVPLSQLLSGQKLVYTTPEFLQLNAEMTEWVREATKEDRLARIVLDEAHCVLEWGNTFRPSYMRLSHWKAQLIRDVPLTFVTASVSNEAIAKMAHLFQLQMLPSVPVKTNTQVATRHRQMVVIQQITDRPNLRLEIVAKPFQPALWIARRVAKETTIVYCMTQKEAEETCMALLSSGSHAGVYHGGLSLKRREFVRKQWMGGKLTIMCATSAFGMGIDRSDVRFIIHHSLPLSLSSYFQQIGRSGRDGNPSVCVLLYSKADTDRAAYVSTNSPLLDGINADEISYGSSRNEWTEVVAFCEMTTGCRKEHLYSHFGFRFDSSRCVRNCNCNVLLDFNASLNERNDRKEYHTNIETRLKETQVSKQWTIEYQYQKVLAECKRLNLSKRETLSRRQIRDIFEKKPQSMEEMASLRAIGVAKASRYFCLFRFE